MACGDGKCPEFIVNAVLKRVEVGKISRTLQTRLAFAQFKVEHGLEDLPFDTIEPRMQELQDANDHLSGSSCSSRSSNSSSSSSSSDILSSGSSYGESGYSYENHRRCFVEALGKGSADFSDQLQLMNVIRGSSSHRKRHCNHNYEDCNYRVYSCWKRHCSSPLISHIVPPAQGCSQAMSSPAIMSHKHANIIITTDSGPRQLLPPPPLFVADSCRKNYIHKPCKAEIEMENNDELLPPHPSDFKSSPPLPPFSPSPPCTPLPRKCNDNLSCHRYQNVEKRGKESGNEVQSLLNHLSVSPLFRKASAPIQYPPSTPPHGAAILPSSVVSTTRQTCDMLSSDTDPHTPLQAFDFSDFVNITPSPSRSSWAVTPQTVIRGKSVKHR
ncbi:putative cytochrome p450 52a12 [Erysiphe neolycopersici]|uniref:Putative cytochrome p450 52a12 n=1 Tax=Erysiphe neolycopersici TaxID=212602 RepID=A0A420I7H4_9PEZI|nr:putative cytochrome p450 52a12 [Erysiphe neolycopersici]